MALQIHSVVQDAHDFDHAFWRYAIHQEVTSATTVSHNVEATKTWYDVVSSFGAGGIGTVGKLTHCLNERLSIDT